MSKIKILITGYGSENHGSQLMIDTLIQQIHGEIEWIIELPKKNNWRAGLSIKDCKVILPIKLIKFKVQYLLDLFMPNISKRLGIVPLKDIDYVIDISGYITKKKGGKSLIKRKLMLFKEIKSIKNSNLKSIIMLSHSVSNFSKEIVQLSKLADMIFPRDAHTENIYKKTGSRKLMQIVPDFVVANSHNNFFHKLDIEEKIVIIPNFKADYKNFINRIGLFNKDKKLILISFYDSEMESFIPRLKKDILEMGFNKIELISDKKEIIREIQSSELTISSRYHGCCLAIYNNTPLEVIGWSEKYESLIETWSIKNGEVADELLIEQNKSQALKMFDVINQLIINNSE